MATFDVPEEFTGEQVQGLFEMWADFVLDGTKAGHVPAPSCPECVATFNSYVDKVRSISA